MEKLGIIPRSPSLPYSVGSDQTKLPRKCLLGLHVEDGQILALGGMLGAGSRWGYAGSGEPCKTRQDSVAI